MQFEDLPRLWQATGADAAIPDALLADVTRRSRDLARDVRRRDRLETLCALFVAPVFAACVVFGAHPVARLGAAILAIACLLIPLRLRSARRLFETTSPDRPLHAFLKDERERVLAQERLLRSVLWWYLLPLGVGVVLFFGGGVRSLAPAIAYGIVVVAFYGWLYRLNQRAVADELEPRLRDLEAALASLEEEAERLR